MTTEEAAALLWGAMERAADSLGLDLGEDAREIVEDVVEDVGDGECVLDDGLVYVREGDGYRLALDGLAGRWNDEHKTTGAEILAGWRYGDRPTEEQAAACRRSVGRECAGARNPAVCRELCRFD
jgi:hypothetical protein